MRESSLTWSGITPMMRSHSYSGCLAVAGSHRSGARGSAPPSQWGTSSRTPPQTRGWSRCCAWNNPPHCCQGNITAGWLLSLMRREDLTGWQFLVGIWWRLSQTVEVILDPGVGPQLQYQEVNNKVNLSCTVEEVFPEPQISLDYQYQYEGHKQEKEEYSDNKFRYCWSSLNLLTAWRLDGSLVV